MSFRQLYEATLPAPTRMPAPPLPTTVLYCINQSSPESWLTVPSFIGATKFRIVRYLMVTLRACLGERVLVLALSVDDRARSAEVGGAVARDDLAVLTRDSPVPSVCTPGANQYVLLAWSRSTELLLPAGTTIAPPGGVVGPFSSTVLPQIRAGGALGHVPVGTDVVEVGVGEPVLVVGAVGDGVGLGVVPPWLVTRKVAERMVELRPERRTTVTVCEPSASFVVSYGRARRLAPVPAKSNGAVVSTRKGRPGAARVVEVELDPGEEPCRPHEDVDLPLHGRAVESYRARPVCARAHRDPGPGVGRCRLQAVELAPSRLRSTLQ